MKTLLRGLGGLLAAFVAVPLAFLLEAHVEMRRLNPELPSLAELRAIPPGPSRLVYVDSGSRRRDDGRNGTYGGFVLTWPDGRAFAIDVGMTRPGLRDFVELMGGDPASMQVRGSMAEQLGASAAAIEGVAFTHLHYDHTDGMGELCDAKGSALPVYQTSDQAQRGNYVSEPGRDDLVEAGCAEFVELEGEGLLPLPGFEGLAAFALAGHTPGSTGFAANVDGTLWIVSGDISNALTDLTGDVPKPWVYSTFIVPEATERLGLLRPWLADLHARPGMQVLVSHDLDAIRASGIAVFEPGGS